MKPGSSSALNLIIFGLLLLIVSACNNDDNPLVTPDPVEYGGPIQSVFLGFERDYLDLDSGIIDTGTAINSPNPFADFYIANNTNTTIHGRVVLTSGREISILNGAKFSEVTVGQADSATFTASFIDEPFDTLSVFLIKTDLGSVFKLGNSVEGINNNNATFDYALMSIVAP